MAAGKRWFDSEHPYDASFSCGMLLVDGRRITAFIDDADPVRVEDVTSAEIIPTVNGTFAIAKKPAIAKIVISVISGTDDEKFLREHFVNSVYLSRPFKFVKIELVNGHEKRFVFNYCVCLGSTPAFSVSSNGKTQGMRYVFGALALHQAQ